ncbi:MAG: 23S rRNA (guanosine(2251)-2'-O)-methyltransferase RlmB [Actinobacteria bacterium]|nr:23S rRNA (guanosine(2251)-2'-O)-methyltransferase RlmB [Actinomycetota bacterium]
MSPAKGSKGPKGRGGQGAGRGRGGSGAGRGGGRGPKPGGNRAPKAMSSVGGHGRAPRRTATQGLGGEQVEGRQAVRELLLANRRATREIWLASDLDPAPVLDDIRELAAEARVVVKEVGRGKLEAAARTDAPQGVLAFARPLPEASLDDLLTKGRGGTAPFLLLSDGITDPGNLGALLRSAECAGVTGVVLPRHRAVHVTPAVTKAAAGAIEHLPMALVGGMPTAIRELQKAGVQVVGLDERASRTVWDLRVGRDAVALVLGAEGPGLSRLVKDRCDEVVRIPMDGRLASLNVATAGALACFEVARARHG